MHAGNHELHIVALSSLQPGEVQLNQLPRPHPPGMFIGCMQEVLISYLEEGLLHESFNTRQVQEVASPRHLRLLLGCGAGSLVDDELAD